VNIGWQVKELALLLLRDDGRHINLGDGGNSISSGHEILSATGVV
jgi:hypothetical protein